MKRLWKSGNILPDSFKDRQSMWHDRLDIVSGECRDHWTRRHRRLCLQPRCTGGSSTAQWQQKHMYMQRQPRRSAQLQERGMPRDNCLSPNMQTKMYLNPIVQQQQRAEPPVSVCTKISDAKVAESYTVCWPKSCFRTEVPKFEEF